MGETLVALEAIDQCASHEYDDVHQIYMKRLRQEERLIGFRSLIEHLKFSKDFLDLHHYRSRYEENWLFVNHNQTRTVIVDYVYTMSRFWNGPPLVTAPGSDYSALCSLVLEIVSGVADESLSGAINRFARSEDRRKIDLEESEEKLQENQVESDKFYYAKDTIKRSIAKCEKYVAMLKDGQIDDGPKFLLKLLIQEELERAKAAGTKYGPHLVWVSQIPQSYLDEKFGSIDIGSKRSREAEIKLDSFEGKTRSQIRREVRAPSKVEVNTSMPVNAKDEPSKRGVAQWDRAPVVCIPRYGQGGRRFESCRRDNY